VIIDMNRYTLHAPTDCPYINVQRRLLDNWNDETIWGRWFSGHHMRIRTTPRSVGGLGAGAESTALHSWPGVGPTQQLVDAFAMNTGRFPVLGRNADGSPILAAGTGYTEIGFTDDFVHPLDGGAPLRTFNMFVNREPRFYSTILWSGQRWPYNVYQNPDGIRTYEEDEDGDEVFIGYVLDGFVSMAHGGNAGPGPDHNFTRTGYLFRTWTDPEVNISGHQWGDFVFPLFRFANTLLNYVEALNEYSPGHPHILQYWNMVRARAGVPDIQEVYPEVVGNQALAREMIRRERQVEFAFENRRFFDTRTWMIATETDNGPMWGQNIMATTEDGMNSTPDGFFQPRVFSTRVFLPRHFLFPIPQREIDRNNLLTQNFGW
jgi:hypothetical protein